MIPSETMEIQGGLSKIVIGFEETLDNFKGKKSQSTTVMDYYSFYNGLLYY